LPLVDAPPNELAIIWLRGNGNPYLPLLLEETRRIAVSGQSVD
jgi:hypothetical protein